MNDHESISVHSSDRRKGSKKHLSTTLPKSLDTKVQRLRVKASNSKVIRC